MPERTTGTTSRTVAIQGERGSFSHAAVLELLGTDWMPQPHPTFDGAFQAVAGGKAERALIPFENSLAGSIHENYDRLSASPLHIIGETQLRIRQCLIARPGSTLAVIRRVASHPVALAQCRTFFAEHPGVEAIATYDTAGSVMDLLRDGPATQAAIGPALAASLYGGQILLESIEDDPENYTRFLLLAREPVPAGAGLQDVARLHDRERAGRAAPRAGRLRQPGRGPGQDRVAPAERAALGVFVLPRRARRPRRGGGRGHRGAARRRARSAHPRVLSGGGRRHRQRDQGALEGDGKTAEAPRGLLEGTRSGTSSIAAARPSARAVAAVMHRAAPSPDRTSRPHMPSL